MEKLTKEGVAVVFAANPGYTTLYFAADGTPFLTENYAKQYARENKLDPTIQAIDKDADLEETPVDQNPEPPVFIRAEDLINAINAVTTKDEFEALKIPGDEKRATVIKALAEKRTALGIE